MFHSPSFLTRRDVPLAPVSTPPASRPLPSEPGACTHDNGIGVLPSTEWPFDDRAYAMDDDLPRWGWLLVLATLFALVFLILGYSLATLVQSVGPV